MRERKTQGQKFVQLLSPQSPPPSHLLPTEMLKAGKKWGPGFLCAQQPLSAAAAWRKVSERFRTPHDDLRAEPGLWQQSAGKAPGGRSRDPPAGERLTRRQPGRNCLPGAGVGKGRRSTPPPTRVTRPTVPSYPPSAFPILSPRSRVGPLAGSHPTDRNGDLGAGWVCSFPTWRLGFEMSAGQALEVSSLFAFQLHLLPSATGKTHLESLRP